MTNKQFIYLLVSFLTSACLFFFFIYKIDAYLSLNKTKADLERAIALTQDHTTVTNILRARTILSDLSARDAEFKEAQVLCMKDVASFRSPKTHMLINQAEYCRDRAITFMGYEDMTYKSLKFLSVTPLPTGISVKGI